MPPASSYVRRGERGATLAELLVVLTIVSILAAVAIPFAETAAQRRHELALRDTLRDVRDAIDAYHDDWSEGDFGEAPEHASPHGFPTGLAVLVEGVMDEEGTPRRYLRRFPRNPFAPRDAGVEEQWLLLGYTDAVDATLWNGEDVYDLRPRTERTALDGSDIADW